MLKKKDSYFRVVNIKLLSIDNIEEDNRYKLERLLDKYMILRDNKD